MIEGVRHIGVLIRERFFVLGIGSVSTVLAAAYAYFGPYIAVRGGYVLLGLLGSAALLRYMNWKTTGQTASWEPSVGWQGTILIVNLAVIVVALTGSRLAVLLFLLPIGYLLLAVRLFSGVANPTTALVEACALFAVNPVTKYLATGVYVGNSDLLLHIPDVVRFVRTGKTSVIAANNYDQYPGLHVFAGEVSMLSGLAEYDALILSGIVIYLLAVVLVFVWADYLFESPQIAFYIALGATVMYPISYYSTYFFPQSFTVVLILFFLFLTFRAANLSGYRRWKMLLCVFVILTPTIFTHHLTFILFVPLTASLILAPIIGHRVFGVNALRPLVVPIVVGYSLAVINWVREGLFLRSFLNAILFVWRENPFASSLGQSSSTVVRGLGTTVPSPTVKTAFHELIGPTGVYYALLVLFFSVGLLAFFYDQNAYERAFGVVVTGILSAAFVFQTPLTMTGGIRRIRLPMSFFFAFVIGIGLYRTFQSARRPGTKPILILLLVLLGVTGTLLAADDIARLDNPPQDEAALSDEEYGQLRYANEFIESHESHASSMWLTQRAMTGFKTPINDDVRIGRNSIRPPEQLFLYRESWPGHRVSYQPTDESAISAAVITEAWLDRTVATENKVYSAGSVGMLWSENRHIDPTPEASGRSNRITA